mmetsp:Transcript_28742/g.61697  ORF Transcript_28742/g.61697 Transcript_28742/m.61697 type:complete len:143 (-) Transcript_28742:136-564(-)
MALKIESPPKSDAASAASSSFGESTCHILPCNVQFEGMAKTHIFFKPIQVENSVLASTFRGRGLLATQEEADEIGTGKYPHLFSLEENQIQSKVSVANFVEWRHESSVKSIMYKGNECSRVQLAKEWIEISKSLHEPLPFED